jgi:hypothetical protein
MMGLRICHLFNGSKAASPVFEDDHIAFNGQTPGACEPFEIARVEFDRRGRPQVWSFCKTERHAYDLCVKVALVILAHHLHGDFSVASDGGDEDWASAKRIVQERLGFGDEFSLRRD